MAIIISTLIIYAVLTILDIISNENIVKQIKRYNDTIKYYESEEDDVK